MTCRPILFSGPLIRALLNTTPDVWPAEPIDPALPCKSQTRRLIRGGEGASDIYAGEDDGLWVVKRFGDPTQALIKCPYARVTASRRADLFPVQPDLLWVRECFYLDERNRKGKVPQEVIYAATPEWAMDYTGAIVRVRFITGEPVDREEAKQSIETNRFWHKKPSIHMPRWASRLTLEVESVRVERVQDITEEDARAEGCPAWEWNPEQPLTTGERAGDSPYRSGFACLWDEIHDEPTWKSNPWVWVITFKRLSQEVAQRRLAA